MENSSFVGPEDICHYCHQSTRHSALLYNYTDHKWGEIYFLCEKPYNGRSPNSIVTMGKFINFCFFWQILGGDNSLKVSFHCLLVDNHPVHRLTEVRYLITGTGALLQFLPPYCPDLNPVEMVIANAKAAIRKQELLFSSSRRPQGLVLLAIR